MVCKQGRSAELCVDGTCFNPCYVGLWSVRSFEPLIMVFSKCFNPCYVGLWSVSHTFWHNLSQNPLFQSLLCWIMVCKTALSSVLELEVQRFNPCYVGLWSVS